MKHEYCTYFFSKRFAIFGMIFKKNDKENQNFFTSELRKYLKWELA
jgi:hypothetical protein